MHPIEHLIYWSCTLIHFIIPSHPVHFFFNAQHAALVPYGGHDGFEGPLLRGLLPAGDYMHYLHHKHISCNYGTIIVPYDHYFKSLYGGEGKYPFTIDWGKKKGKKQAEKEK
jgi:sterol desaturase/sphingolipid hydroxylase (fatty acid hydroxylase superfamily)